MCGLAIALARAQSCFNMRACNQALMAEVAEKGHNLAAKIELLSMAVKLVGTSTRLQMEAWPACRLLLSLIALPILGCCFFGLTRAPQPACTWRHGMQLLLAFVLFLFFDVFFCLFGTGT
jgi:hypothetical protein